MSTTIADNTDQSSILLDDGTRRDRAVLVGTAMRGLVYRSSFDCTWYRVLSMDDAPLDWRHRIRERSHVQSQTVLSPQRDWQQLINGRPHFVIAYHAEQSARSLAELLEGDKPDDYLRGIASYIRVASAWWQQMPPPLFVLAADVIIHEDGKAQLLGIPNGPLPNVQMVFHAPRRAMSLAPEFVRSAISGTPDSSTWEAIDRYVIGVVAIHGLCHVQEVHRVEQAMFRSASGSLLRKLDPRKDLPPWLDRFTQHRQTLSQVRRLCSADIHTRFKVDLAQLANRFDRLRELLDPRVAAMSLRDRTQPHEALDLVQQVLPVATTLGIGTESQYDLMCLAGELCAQYLYRPVEAVDYYERAIDLNPAATKAYREQLCVIAGARHQRELAALLESSKTIATEADTKLWRDYRILAGSRSTHAVDDLGENDDRVVASYTLWRQQFDVARDFIFPRLKDAKEVYIWWDFDLNLSYVQAFLGLAATDHSNLARAAEQLQLIKNGLNFAASNRSMDPPLLQQYGQKFAELEHTIHQMKLNQTNSRGTPNGS